MEIYRLWYLRQQGEVLGPFPEKLICRFIVLGRLGEQDEVSIDGMHWAQAGEVPELAEGVKDLLTVRGTTADVDPEWSEERAKAILRWLDDRKSPDPREQKAARIAAGQDKRSGKDRREAPETVEQHAYREWRGEFESWMRNQRQRNGFVWRVGLAFAAIALLFIVFNRPVNPIKVGLQVRPVDCQLPPAQGVDWSGCAKDDILLVGVDLSHAQLVGTSLRNANLSHADLRGANLARANLSGAKLEGARLDQATWIDGRICAQGSIGRCNE
jgi:hypothetical protein